MRVCFLRPNILPLFGFDQEDPFGGAEVQIYQIARYLVQHGFHVDVICRSDGEQTSQVKEGVHLIPSYIDASAVPLSEKIRAKLKLISALNQSNADIYVTTCASPDTAIVALYARTRNKRFVYRVAHEIDCDGSYEREGGLRGRLFGLGLRLANAVVAQHRSQHQILGQRGISSTVIHNAFDATGPALARERDADALWVGRSESWKQPGLFLELAAALPKRKFVMICSQKHSEKELFESLRRRADELQNVVFIDKVPFADSQSYFARAKVLVGTSKAEGYPNTYIQACIAGTPIVSYCVDPEGFIGKGAGIVAGGSFDNLLWGVTTILADERQWTRASQAARERALSTHDIRLSGPKWAKLFRSLQTEAPNASRSSRPGSKSP